jgi:hypothetical protein
MSDRRLRVVGPDEQADPTGPALAVVAEDVGVARGMVTEARAEVAELQSTTVTAPEVDVVMDRLIRADDALSEVQSAVAQARGTE